MHCRVIASACSEKFVPIRKSKLFAVFAPPRISISLKSESPRAMLAVDLDARLASPQTSSQEPIQQRSISEKLPRGSSSTIVAVSASFTTVRRTNHSAQWAPSNPLTRTWENCGGFCQLHHRAQDKPFCPMG